ncbi:MAG: dephospho-CoA kinase [Candidatus Marinimicrobia bacterium]|jgi:dephospho-CoA kinase|nr:dephospho-CoA kinase [Candidatus Neomarinimicrobiota bacterium]MBT4318581.1 dephospho-CoA kinase [Candidatus Neomarinimicrobiota bacterium]MBT5439912.1 dephospho-CoA kinase [Candidatus Neomarinimicrobiota bacterium]MDG2366273.1 dephospho-CoA kinase [Candidatus Neomarinimicrobiota bacterium]|tara:strand:- start:666 stop:1259 length:594 start_codon:yes stop_codon:yes gene_type:complete
MLRVGLTGGIGSGKSTASNFFEAFGSFVINADEEAKKLMSSNETVQHELIAEFGTDIIDVSGQINKAKLAKIAFQDEDHQQTLNSVIHPYIYDSIDNQFNRVLKNGKFDIFIVDGALIFESGYDVHMDYIIVVTALLKNRIERALGRKTLSRDEILKRINLQWSEEEKVNLADFVIHNDGSEEDLKNNVKSLIEKLI